MSDAKPTPYDLAQARAFMEERGHDPSIGDVAALIANVREETKRACAEKAYRALDDVYAQLCRPLTIL